MKRMNIFAIACLSLSLVVLLTGCVSKAVAAFDAQAFLNKTLPPDFRGPAHLEERGQYLTLTLDVEGLQKLSDGRWTWSRLEYQRILNLPLTPGIPYKQEAKVRLGPPQ